MNQPTVGSGSGLHTGKWTHEESEYVKELIKEFEAGSLNIEENISLRRFLSKALNCSPKRISKKFEGSLYNGKQLYKRKTSTLTPEEVQARRNKLREMERKYQESLRVLEMVEASRKPSSATNNSNTRRQGGGTGGAAFRLQDAHASLLSPFGAVVGAACATGSAGALHQHQHFGSLSGLNNNPTSLQAAATLSREARIAQLKADIALASMALESGPAAIPQQQQQQRQRVFERSAHSQSDILTALSQHRSSLPASLIRSSSPSSSSATAAALPQQLRARLALNRVLMRRPSGVVASGTNSTITTATPFATGDPPEQRHKDALTNELVAMPAAVRGIGIGGGWKRGLGSDDDVAAAHKRFKLI